MKGINPMRPEDMIRRGVWRFARQLAVGLAWGAPLVPAIAVNSAPGTAVHPGLARPLDQHSWQLLVAMIVLCGLGIAYVALLTQAPSRVRVAWVGVPLALALALVFAFTAPAGTFAVSLIDAFTFLAVPIALVSLGVAITVATLWRRRWWLALTWLSLWLGGVVYVSIATSQTPDSGTPGDGLLVLALAAVLLVVSVVSAMLASVLSGLRGRIARARHIEQAFRADSQ
jgi:peptidoglycan/LPS O-acetylase OafA/YrhL